MTVIQLLCILGLALWGVGYLGRKAYQKYTATAAVKPKTVCTGANLYVFVPDASHTAWLEKFRDALSTTSPEFQLAQLYSGKSVSEALEAHAKAARSE